MERLIALNEITRLNLFLAVAACEGAWAVKMLQPTTRAAYHGLLAPNRRITPDTLSKGFMAFYKTMFRDRSADTGFRAMKEAVLPETRVFSLISARMAFETVLAEYRAREPSEAEVGARLDAIEASGAAAGLSEAQRLEGRARAKRYLVAKDLHFEEFYRRYFFIDRFPENAGRFPITLEDCRPVDAFMDD